MTEHAEMENAAGTELVIADKKAVVAAFDAPERMDAILARLENEVRSHHADTSTAKGRKAIASLAHKVARSKSALDNAGKELTDEQRRLIKAVDAERRRVRDRLDALKAEARKPLTEWEKAEEARVGALKERLARLSGIMPEFHTPASIRECIERVEATPIDDSWEEYLPMAAKAKDATLGRLRASLEDAEAREAQEAELARLRAEAAEREAEDRRRREAEEAEERRRAAEKAEAERQARAEREKQEAADRAAQAERDRIERERQADLEAQRARERDQVHLARVRRDIIDALDELGGGSAEIADALLCDGIPHTKVTL